ncbi:MAG: T9SS type A sorting domain-containing protein [Bacteroidales bacterium]|nr:T9SS type A sorting domain-containing protein [Bacteroidales bacterium]
MKKASFVLAILLSLAISARSSVYLFEQFDDSFLPNGWSVTGIGADYWYISETDKAGGTPNELYMYCGTQGTWRLISPTVDLSGQQSVNFSFKLRYENWGNPVSIGIATSSNNGAQWHQAWTQNLNATNNYEINEVISTEDMGNPNVKFCIFFTNSADYNSSNIYLDDISAFVQRDLDVEVQEINVDEVMASGNFEVGMRLFNTGSTTVNSVEGFYQFEGQAETTQTFSINIPASSFANVNFDVPADLIPDNYLLTVGIRKVNGIEDEDPSNNSLAKTISIACATTQRLPMFEHFTASSCGTCPQLSNQMQTFCNNNPGKYTYVKYQMNWPAPGDPYYTNEGGVRKTYYNVIALPTLFMDAVDYEFNPVTQGDFDEHYNTPAVVEIKGSYWVEGNMIHVTADLMPFADLDNVKVHVAVSEKTTHNNATTNGETSFHHVMMKMLPNAQGTTMSFHAGQLETLSFDQNMANTHVEEMDDLEVAVWIQKHDTKRVYNSRFLFETPNHPYAPENLTLTTSGNSIVATWDAPSQGNPTGYNIWLDETLVAENANETSHTFSASGSEFHCVQVQAVYGDEIVSVKAVATTMGTVGTTENTVETLTLYPNPASETVHFQGVEADKILVHNALGQLVKTLSKTNEISVTDFTEGIYQVTVIGNDGLRHTARLVVTH